MLYALDFVIFSEDQEIEHQANCNKLFGPLPDRFASTRVSGIPLPTDVELDAAVFHHYGPNDTREGFDPRDGDLRVIKLIEISNDAQRERAVAMWSALDVLQGKSGLVPVMCYSLSSFGHPSTARLACTMFIVQQHAVPINDRDWTSADSGVKLSIIENLTETLASLHELGYMHRAIDASSIGVFDENPPQVGFFDLGDLVHNSKNLPTTGHLEYMPPEVYSVSIQGLDNYDFVADTWELGRALTIAWKRNACPMPKQLFSYRFPTVHPVILERLRAEPGPVTSVLARMLEWDFIRRPTPRQLLDSRPFKFPEPAVSPKRSKKGSLSPSKSVRFAETTEAIEGEGNESGELGLKHNDDSQDEEEIESEEE